MDITGIDVGALLTGLGAFLKSFHSDRASAETKKTLEQRCAALEQRLNDGDRRFSVNETKIDKVLDKIGQIDKGVTSIVSYLKGKGLDID